MSQNGHANLPRFRPPGAAASIHPLSTTLPSFQPARVFLAAAVTPVKLVGKARCMPGGWVDFFGPEMDHDASEVLYVSYPAQRIVRVEWLDA